MHNIAVVIPVYNEEKFIAKTLNDLAEQSIGYQHFSIVLCDNNSTDNSITIMNRFINQHSHMDVYLIHESRRGTLACRVSGLIYAASAGANLLLSTDADTQIPSNWVMSLSEDLKDGRYAFVAGAIHYSKKFALFSSLYLQKINDMSKYLSLLKKKFYGPTAYGANFGLTSALFLQIIQNDFSNTFSKSLIHDEDLLISFRAHLFGCMFVKNKTIVISSDRRFWANIPAWIGHRRDESYKLIIHTISSKITAQQIEKACQHRLDKFVRYVLVYYVDALHLNTTNPGYYKKTRMVINKLHRFFDLPIVPVRNPRSAYQKLRISHFKHVKNTILKLFLCKVTI